MVVAPEVNSILMVNGKSPGPHLRGERTIELTSLSSIGIDSEEEKGSIILTEREIEGVPVSRLSGAAINPPADGFPDRDSKIPEGKRNFRIEEGDANRHREEESNQKMNHRGVRPYPLFPSPRLRLGIG